MNHRALTLHPDDEPGSFLADRLDELGYIATSFAESDRAIAWARQHQPDLVFLNRIAPVMAAGVCETLKLDPVTNLIPIFMIVGAEENTSMNSNFHVSPNACLSEPYTAEQLRQAAQETLTWRSDLRQQGVSNEVCFHLTSTIPSLEKLTQLLESLFRRSGVSEDEVKRLKIAVRELGINAIEWGHRKEENRIITVIFRTEPNRITVTIRDTGPGFDPQRIPHAARSGDPVGHLEAREALGLREGGFGIVLARGLVDELRYNERGNEACLIKYLSPAPAEETGELARMDCK
jgi:anti-sigma regulatory factor (Ser/Thr protein kinase)/CheY-like chemotaxis protein